MTVVSSDPWETVAAWGLSIGQSALLRSLLIGMIAVRLSPSLAAWVTGSTPGRRRFAFVAALTPMFAPPLIVGYCYSTGVFLLVHQPLANTVCYSLLLLLKTVPVGMLVILFSPGSPISRTAFYCHQLLPARSWCRTALFWIQGPLHHRVPVFTVCFLVAFQEFEIASLMSVGSWTVDIFDAQARGIRPSHTVGLLWRPLLIICAAVLPTVCILARRRRRSPHRNAWMTSQSRWAGTWFVVPANLLLWGIPLCTIGTSLSHSATLMDNPAMLSGFIRELSSALGFAFCGATLTMLSALFVLRTSDRTRSRAVKTLTVAMLIPGLSGALSVTLCVYLAVQSGLLISLRETPFPAVFGMAVFLLPRAVLLLLLFQGVHPDKAVFTAGTLSRSADERQMTAGLRVLWQLEDRAIFWTFAAVFIWGFYNLTTASLLVPVGIVPLPVRLYNLMHYGQSSSLSIQALLSVTVPPVLMLLAVFGIPRLQHLLARKTLPGQSQIGSVRAAEESN